MSRILYTLVFVLLFLFTSPLNAQQMGMPQVMPAEDVSQQELEQFVDVAMDLQGIRVEVDSLMTVKLDEEGMSAQRFRQIMMGQQDPNTPPVELTTEEEQQVGRLQTFLQQVSMEAQQKQMQVIQEAPMDQMRFQGIAKALQTDKELAIRFQAVADSMEAASAQ
jgi:hypothetical protein